MTIKQQGGIFGRNPTFNDVTVDGTLTSGSISVSALDNVPIGATTPSTGDFTAITGEVAASGYAADFRNTRNNQDGGGLYVQTRYNNSVNSILKLATNSGSATALEVRGDLDMDVYGSIIMKNSGEGIDFSATSDASGSTSELFDDYEEGTWTPAYAPTTGAFTEITTISTGRYTKVGRLVHLQGTMRTSGTLTVGTASGNLQITGLPFTNSSQASGAQDFNHQSWNLGTDILNASVVVNGSVSYLLLYKNTLNGSSFPSGNITVSEMNTGGGSFSNLINFSLTYTV